MMLGLRDYVRKNRFPGVVLGMSGGIDSALTAAVAVDALGAAHVRGVRLPSRFTSDASLDDAEESARLLGMRLDTVPIEAPVAATETALAPLFDGRPRDVTEENLQARIRGVLLMALSNKFGELLVTTGNKSEMSVGYATLYGDMCGGYSVLKDIYKTEVYALARWRNTTCRGGRLRPARPRDSRIVHHEGADGGAAAQPDGSGFAAAVRGARRDSARPDRGGAERRRRSSARGFARETVTRVQRLLYSAEYKRRQAPPGVKITRKSFGRDRRYPLTNAFRET